ncbi:MAG: glycosyltransferase family 39 protein [Proteobacteria bacterium]|nr:glycosyltransferase family 39 protein [Pseudomonadota bacterium]
MNDRFSPRDAIRLALLLALLTAVALARPLLPVDETRYAGVAWEMWTRGDFLVPFRNGEAYHHKPPLLFWLIHAGWALVGVNDWWPRLISPLFAGGTLLLGVRLARRLWPQQPVVAAITPYVLLASLLFAYFATALMFDAMLAFFVALGLLGLVAAHQDGGACGFVLLALGLGGALYAKGPVALLHLLPAALAAPWWAAGRAPGARPGAPSPPRAWRRWYAGVGLALLGGAALILAWAIPAAIAGGPEYRNAIFWGQTAGRMASSFAHRAAWWFYFAWLPLMLLPWLPWPRLWRALRAAFAGGWLAEPGVRLMLFVCVSCLLAFSLISGKRWHYLLPQFLPFALLAARALAGAGGDAGAGAGGRRIDLLLPALGLVLAGTAVAATTPRLALLLGGGSQDLLTLRLAGAAIALVGVPLLALRPRTALADVRAIATAMVLAYALGLGAADRLLREPQDVAQTAARLAQYQAEGRPLAIVGDYHGQWHLAGRLRRPIEEVAPGGGAAWLAAHPDGRLIVIHKRDDVLPAGAHVDYRQARYRNSQLTILAP